MLANRMRMSAGGILEATWIDKASSTSNTTSYDFGDWTATAGGILVVGACSSQDDPFSSITIGGTAASLGPQDGSGNSRCTMARRSVAAGAHNITVNFAGNQTFCAIGVWLLTGNATLDSNDAAGSASVTSIGASFTLGTGSILLACSTHNNTNSTSWSSATADDGVAVESNHCSWATLIGTSGSHTETASWSGTTSGAIAGRSWV